MNSVLVANLLSPFVLAFALGVGARLLKSDLALPADAQTTLSTFLLFAIGLHGGAALASTPLTSLPTPLAATLALGVITPVSAFAVLRGPGRFSASDAAGIAAHYGSVSAVTVIAAQQFVASLGIPSEGLMTTLLTVLEAPGIAVALTIGGIAAARERVAGVAGMQGGGAVLAGDPLGLGTSRFAPDPGTMGAIVGVLRSKSMMLLGGGLLIGILTPKQGWESVAAVFDTKSAIFKGALTLFLLQLGVEAGGRLGALRKVGGFLIAFGTVIPLAHGCLGVVLGTWAGLSVGGATVLGAMAASASYIAAPPAVRAALPDANPTYSIVAALAITFPFNLIVGIPLYHHLAVVAR